MAMAQCLCQASTASLRQQGLLLPSNSWRGQGSVLGHRLRCNGGKLSRRHVVFVRAMDASIGGSGGEEFGGPPAEFPRMRVRDPFKLLGVSREASDEEIWEARNYLSAQYANHEKSRKSIEAAYDRIIMSSLKERKNPKINLKSTLQKKVAEAPPWVRWIMNRFEVPESAIILPRAGVFLLLGVWSVLDPTAGGPAFQVVLSLAACVYFLKDKLKSLGRGFLIGVIALVLAWVSGSVVVPVLLSHILPSSWSLELSTALYSYIILWAACTFLK